MSNPLVPQNNGFQIDPRAVASVKNMMSSLQAVQHPEKAIEMLASQNPQIASILSMAKGGSLKDAFYKECKSRGIDPESVLSQLR